MVESLSLWCAGRFWVLTDRVADVGWTSPLTCAVIMEDESVDVRRYYVCLTGEEVNVSGIDR